MRCAKCGSDNREGAKFCSQCATAFAAKCPRCGAVNPPGAKFCDECAAPLDAAPRAGAADPSRVAREPGPSVRVVAEQADAATVLEGERKTVTALFADIKGSTALMDGSEPLAATITSVLLISERRMTTAITARAQAAQSRPPAGWVMPVTLVVIAWKATEAAP